MTGRRLLVAGGLLLVATACSGDDDASPATTQVAPAPESTSTTEATVAMPETTPPVPETTPATLPAEPTTTATTAAPPETTAPPTADQIKQDVIDATIASWTAFNDLLLDPRNDELVAILAVTRTGEALERAIEIAVDYRAKNQAERTHPRYPARVEVVDGSVSVDRSADSAIVEYCRLASNIWVEVGTNPGGADRILDDSISAYLEQDMLTLVDGNWLRT